MLQPKGLAGIIVRVGEAITRFGRWTRGASETSAPATVHSTDNVIKGPSVDELNHYTVFIKRLEHENELTNHRLNWNLAIQGFLFFTLAYCIEAMATLEAALLRTKSELDPGWVSHLETSIESVRYVAKIICGLGIAVNIFIFWGALAAQFAIWTIDRHWRSKHQDFRRNLPWRKGFDRESPWKWTTHSDHLPGSLGGGLPAAHVLGLLPPLLLPVAFVLAWIWIVRFALPHI
jgi:hypothetical protein